MADELPAQLPAGRFPEPDDAVLAARRQRSPISGKHQAEERRREEQRPGDAPEPLPPARPVERRRLEVLLRDVVQPGQIEKHIAARLPPDRHQRDGRHHPGGVGEPGERLEGRQRAKSGGVGRAAIGDELGGEEASGVKHDLADELSAANLVALNERADKVLADLWNNPKDAAYDKL